MDAGEIMRQVDLPSLKIIRYPDPRLRAMSVELPEIDDAVRALAGRMLELMFAARGVGLAAAQVGVNVRMFVSSPTFEESDRRVYVNPAILSMDGSQEGDEGCLSLPGINTRVKRYDLVTLRAMNLDGEVFEETGEEILARIFQHETDHIDGRLLVDRMGSVARLSHRRTLKDLEEQFDESRK